MTMSSDADQRIKFTSRNGTIDFSRQDLRDSVSLQSIFNAQPLKLDSTSRSFRCDECKFSEDSLITICEYIEKKPSIKEVSFSWNHFSEEFAAIVCKMFKRQDNVEIFHLNGNLSTLTSKQQLALDLSQTANLKVIHLQDNGINSSDAELFATYVLSRGTLLALDIRNNNISHEGIDHFKNIMISRTCPLKALDISFNRLGTSAGIIISQILSNNSILQELNIEGNQLEDEGIIHIADALKDNHTLTYLNLSSNSCALEGAIHLADALKVNKSVEELLLSRSHGMQPCIGEEGAYAFAEMLQTNTTLKKLDLYWGCIGPKGADAIAESLTINTSLLQLNVGGNFIGPAALLKIQDALQPRLSSGKNLTTLRLFERPTTISEKQLPPHRLHRMNSSNGSSNSIVLNPSNDPEDETATLRPRNRHLSRVGRDNFQDRIHDRINILFEKAKLQKVHVTDENTDQPKYHFENPNKFQPRTFRESRSSLIVSDLPVALNTPNVRTSNTMSIESPITTLPQELQKDVKPSQMIDIK